MSSTNNPRKRTIRKSRSELGNGNKNQTNDANASKKSNSMDISNDKNDNDDNFDVYDGFDCKTTIANDSTKTILFSPVVSLPILVFVDMFAVALVVPLLFQYYKHAGVTSATQRELLSSVFSASQIVGGVSLGALTDAKILRKKTVLFVSFGGSAVAYCMITYGGYTALVLSRIIVGLVKQTMTITTSILTKCTTEDNRAKYMGRLESSATAAWILGPSSGALLYKCTHTTKLSKAIH
jgi:hypothetical protein